MRNLWYKLYICSIHLLYYMKLFLTATFFLLLIFSASSQNYCIKNRFSSTPLFSDSQIEKDTNVVFAVAKHWNSNVMDSLRMDVYYPSDAIETLPKRPLIVFAFGGGFLDGSRTDFTYFCKEFAKRGYVAATIDYRVGWNCVNGTAALLCLCNDYISMYNATYRAVQDFNASLRYLSFKSAKYKIDTNYVFVSGGSAGSITAMNAAFTSQAEADAKLSWVHTLLGSLDSSGNSYPKRYKIKGVLDFCGAVFDTSIMANNADIAVVSFHDSSDCVVPAYHGYVINCTGNCYNLFTVDGSALIYRKAIQNGSCAELHINPGTTHCGSNQNYVIENGSCFLKRVMCNTCSSSRYRDQKKIASCDSLASGIERGSGSEANGFKVYPNPARDVLRFDFINPISSGLISIYDDNGKEVLRQAVNGRSLVLPVLNWNKGLYLVRLESGNTIQTLRVILHQ